MPKYKSEMVCLKAEDKSKVDCDAVKGFIICFNNEQGKGLVYGGKMGHLKIGHCGG